MPLRPLTLVLLGMLATSALACDPGTAKEQPGASSSTTATALGDGEWELRADRSLRDRPGVQRIPSDRLTEADFEHVSGLRAYRVLVSDGGSRVSVQGVLGDGLVEGQRTGTVDGRMEYDVPKLGWGGRLIVWPASGGLQAETAAYGSGVAFLRCERGALVRLPPR